MIEEKVMLVACVLFVVKGVVVQSSTEGINGPLDERQSHKLMTFSTSSKDVISNIFNNNDAPLPTFSSGVENQTVIAGRSAELKCSVKNLGNYKVAWVRVDTQTILTIHTNIITRNQRVSLSQHDNKQWRLHLKKVQEADRGWYMCQINTDPMRSERGYLKVVVPPTIIDSKTSQDIIVEEGSSVNMTCEALGSPEPRIMWKREDNKMIRYDVGEANSVAGNWFSISSVSRTHIGAYFCIASNNVPPSVSKRIELKVQFSPMVRVENQLELAYVSQRNITLHCTSEAFPPAIHYWIFSNKTAIIGGPGKRFVIREYLKSYTTKLSLTIKNVRDTDFGTYRCLAKNSLGDSDGSIKLSERDAPPVKYTNPPPLSPPDDFDQTSIRERDSRYKHKYEGENGKNPRWDKSNGDLNHDFDEEQLNTYSPFFQNQGTEENKNRDAKYQKDTSQKKNRNRKRNENHSTHNYHINNGSRQCYDSSTISTNTTLLLLLAYLQTILQSPVLCTFYLIVSSYH